MNILNVFYSFQSGGVERLGIDVSNQMSKIGHNTHLCVISNNYSNELLSQFLPKVKLHCLVKRRNRKIGYIRQLLDIIDKDKIDIIHVHQGSLMLFYTILKVLRPKIKFFFTVHDTYIYSELSAQNRILSKLICNKLIAISDAVADDIRKNGVSDDKISRVYNGVNFEKFPFIKRDKREISTIEIVNVARFYPPKKGQDVLIKAASILIEKGYDIHISFAGGEIKPKLAEIPKMKALAKNLKVEDKISFLGNVNNVLHVLKMADIFCIPSRYEGFGISAVEAMATGLPCVASNIIGLNEVINDKYLGELFEMNNEQDLANKLSLVIDKIKEYDSKTIRRNVINRFSIESMCKSLVSLYLE